MSTSQDFTDLLQTQVEDAKRPPPLPAGTWIFQVQSFQDVVSSRKGTPGIEFTLKPLQPGDDVEKEALEAYQAEVDLAQKTIAGNDTTFWITKDAMPMLRDFVEKCGLDISGKTFKQVLAHTAGCQIKGFVKHVPSQRDGDDSMFANINGYIAVE